MNVLKETAIQAIRDLPDEITLADIIEAITLKTKAISGMREIEKGNFISSDALREEVEGWK